MFPLEQFKRWPGYDIGGTVGVKDQVQLPAVRVPLASLGVLVHQLTQPQPEVEATANGPASMEIDPAIQCRLQAVSGIAADSPPVVRVCDIQFN